jgi:alpha-D-ribose 1-methylphosphonate 5-triphosphate synthase subunit PhnI
VEFEIPELGFTVEIGEIEVTECESVNQFLGSKTEPPQFTRGYGLVFGQSERKAMAMALVDRALRWRELGEDPSGAPAQDEEFVLMHGDNVQATGFLEHIKLPHYVDFQAELEMIRAMRRECRIAEAAQTSQEARSPRHDRGLQLRLSRRADQADDPPRAPEGPRHPGLSGAVRLAARCRCPMAGAPAACR